MIKHIVMWKIKDFAEGNDKRTNMAIAKERLMALKGTIEVLEHIEIGINVTNDASACDMVLYSEFRSLEDLEAYQKHPAHLKVAEFVGKIRESRAVVDYEV